MENIQRWFNKSCSMVKESKVTATRDGHISKKLLQRRRTVYLTCTPCILVISSWPRHCISSWSREDRAEYSPPLSINLTLLTCSKARSSSTRLLHTHSHNQAVGLWSNLRKAAGNKSRAASSSGPGEQIQVGGVCFVSSSIRPTDDCV